MTKSYFDPHTGLVDLAALQAGRPPEFRPVAAATRRRPAPRPPAPAPAPRAAAPAPAPSAGRITTSSEFDRGHQVTIDPYGTNPLEEDARQNLRGIRMSGQAPKMFAGGTEDLPAFTATGLDPRLLLKLPYGVRHYAAAEPSLAAVHGIFERSAGNPHMRLDHEGLTEAIGRVSHWLFNQGSVEEA